MLNEYTLETHLEEICKENPKYAHLYASLTLDKPEITKILAEIIYNTPHYSTHDISHSESILNKIEMLLGEKRIKKLGPTETWLIIMAAFTHDIGMVIFHDKIKEDWTKGEFQKFILETNKNSFDKDLQEAAQLVTEFNVDELNTNKTWPLDIKNAVNLLISDYYRSNHAEESMHNIESSTHMEEKTKLFLTASSIENNRIINLLGELCFSHSWKSKDILKMYPKTNGSGTDIVHPRLISSLLRLGDLLDLDNNRFNRFSEKMIGKLPDISKIHKEKHESIKHFLVTPKSIEISADCPNAEVYRELRKWIDYLEEEVQFQSVNWNSIAPEDFGTAPQITKTSFKINGQKDPTLQAGLQLHISPEKAFKFIEGSGIYDNSFIFIRELIQNAIDATKIQIWRDICTGRYASFLVDENENGKEISIEELKRAPQLLDSKILKNYPITIELDLEEIKGGKVPDDYNFIFKITDSGTGISRKDLERICNVGNSYKTDHELVDFIEDMPFYLKPTAAFGLGLQSCFIQTDRLNIETRSYGEKTKEIEMVSRQTNGYVTVIDKPDEKNTAEYRHGTTLTVKINKKELEKLEQQNVSIDPFSEENGYLIYLREYTKSFIKNITLFYFIMKCEGKNKSLPYSNPLQKRVNNIEIASGVYLNKDKDKVKPVFTVLDTENEALVTIVPMEWATTTNDDKNISVKIRGIKSDISEELHGSGINRTKFSFTIDILSEKSDELLLVSRNRVRDKKMFKTLISNIYKTSLEILFSALDKYINLQKDDKVELREYISDDESRFILNYEAKVYHKNPDYNITDDDTYMLEPTKKFPLLYKLNLYDIFKKKFILSSNYIHDINIILKKICKNDNDVFAVLPTSPTSPNSYLESFFMCTKYFYFSNNGMVQCGIYKHTEEKTVNSKRLFSFNLKSLGNMRSLTLGNKYVSNRTHFEIDRKEWPEINPIKLNINNTSCVTVYSPFTGRGNDIGDNGLLEDIKTTIDFYENFDESKVKSKIIKLLPELLPQKLLEYIKTHSIDPEVNSSKQTLADVIHLIFEAYSTMILAEIYPEIPCKKFFLVKKDDLTNVLSFGLDRTYKNNYWTILLFVLSESEKYLLSEKDDPSDSETITFMEDNEPKNSITLEPGFNKISYNDKSKVLTIKHFKQIEDLFTKTDNN